MAEVHYLISDASRKVDVEAHVLRYWEDELELKIPRNEMGHRFYTEFHIRLFKQVKMLKDKGYQLKAIKTALAKSLESDGKVIIPNEVLEEDVLAALREAGASQGGEIQEEGGQAAMDGEAEYRKQGQEIPAAGGQDGQALQKDGEGEVTLAAETGINRQEPQVGLEEILENGKMEQFQRLMNHIIGRAVEENCEKLSQDIAYMVHEKLLKEMDYLMRVADEKEEERFKRLDEIIRIYQRDNQSRLEAAATKLPFFPFRKRKFGRNGNKL